MGRALAKRFGFIPVLQEKAMEEIAAAALKNAVTRDEIYPVACTVATSGTPSNVFRVSPAHDTSQS